VEDVRRTLFATVALMAISATLGFMATGAQAAQTHSNCVVFDNNNNIVSVVPNCSQTMVFHNETFSRPDFNPCTGAPGILTETLANDIFHTNVNGASDIWVTGTQTGRVTFVPNDSSFPSYAGHLTSWFGASLNKSNSVFHDTFNAKVTGSDGSRITLHMVDHFSVSASGIQNSFSLAGGSCP
jgi:hypothetical protein